MTIRRIELICDTPECGAYCSMQASTPEQARQIAADRYDWTRRDGRDVCHPCDRGDTPQARGGA